MKIEIAIEGPPPAIFELCRRLEHLSPTREDSPDPEDPKARVFLIEEEKNLNERLLEISRIVSREEKDLSLTNKFEFRVRNLAYAEPPVGSARLKESFNPIPSMTIQPWHPSLAPAKGPSTILIDSRHSFGTGWHPTSRLCLACLEDLARRGLHGGLRNRMVLDFGCGTGLLAIAAVKMGAAQAIGVELDRMSAETAGKNVLLNGLSEKIIIRAGSWEVVGGEYDLVFANLVPSVLLRTGDRISNHLKDQGAAVISGFSGRQLSEMERFFTQMSLVKKESMTMDGWAALTMMKRRI
ncbi:MAG: 50S ribosomal protein L11 methyltransferase [Pseudomonadota bacterium]